MLPDLGTGDAGQHRLDVNAAAGQLVLQRLAQAQHVGLGRAIDGIEQLRRQRHHRTKVDDGAAATPAEPLRRAGSQAGQGHHVEGDHPLRPVHVGIGQRTVHRHAGVVHQQRDRGVVAQPSLDPQPIVALGQVGAQDLHPDPVGLAKSIRQGFQALPVARHQQQVVATAGQVLGVGRADSGRGAGDQGDAIANLFVHVGSRWKKA